MKNNLCTGKRGDRGFSLIELMFAVAVLGTAIIGTMIMVVVGIGRNGSNRMDTTATNVAQAVMEGLATMPLPAPPPPAPAPQVTITDCTGAALPLTTALGGATPDPATGDIDFRQPPVPGYQVNYTMCGTNGLRAVYDVRWRVDLVNPLPSGAFARMVTVAAREPMSIQQGKNPMVYIPPVTLRTIVGQ